MKITKAVSRTYLGLIYLFFYLPIIVLIIYSFNAAHYSLIWEGFTFKWYHQLFADEDLWVAAYHSLMLGLSAATSSTLIGLISAVCLYRYRFFGWHFLQTLVFVLILSPDIIMGAALLILFTFANFQLGFISLLLAHISFCIPFVIVTAYSRLVSFDKNIFEAAKDLGASEWLIFRNIILPLMWPALFASWLLTFTLSLDDVIISYFVSGPEFQVLSLYIYSLVRSGITPEINALCTVIFSLTLIFIVLAQLSLKKEN